MNKLLIIGIATLGLIAGSSLANEGTRGKSFKRHQHKPPVTRSITQMKTETGFERHMTKTNHQGQTATRDTTVVNDRENKTRTRRVEGTHYNGSQYSANVVTHKTENGFERNATRTNAKGETATRNTLVENNPETGSRTREVSGTNFKGEQYSGYSVTQKTDDGYTRDSSFTNAQGKTTSRSVDLSIDKQAGTSTKNISVTDANGEVHSKTIVKTRSQRD